MEHDVEAQQYACSSTMLPFFDDHSDPLQKRLQQISDLYFPVIFHIRALHLGREIDIICKKDEDRFLIYAFQSYFTFVLFIIW
jgi:hypothetical protein